MADSKRKPLAEKIALFEQRAAASQNRVLQLQLPLCPEPTRSVPNSMLRSALFGAIRKGARRYLERVRLAALDGLDILYTGQRLDQGDLDAYESVLHAVRLQTLGEQCHVTSYALLKLMGKTDTGKNRQTLHKRLIRLRANAVEIKQGRYTYIGGLIDEAYKDEITQEWNIVLNRKLHALFAPNQFTQIDWAVRHELDGKPLAQWLHGFYASHARPYPVKVETLHKLCGSEAVLLSDFKKDLFRAMNAVAAASVFHSQPFSFEFRGNLVYVEKAPSKSQRRHLARKITTIKN